MPKRPRTLPGPPPAKRRRGFSGTSVLLGAGAGVLGAELAAAPAEARAGSGAGLRAAWVGARSGAGAGGDRPQLPSESSKTKQGSSGRLTPQKC